MISALSGVLHHVTEDRVHLTVGPVVCELLVPAADVTELQANLGREMTLHTIFYIQGDASGGSLEPRLIGFLRAGDRGFFEKLITVKGIGPRKALKALSKPVGEIAGAIEAKDTRYLVALPEIGKRTAELLVAELAGKVGAFATTDDGGRVLAGGRSRVEEDAIATLMALGERRADAERLLERARADESITTTDGLVREMLRLRSA